jgi:hypothetical protein
MSNIIVLYHHSFDNFTSNNGFPDYVSHKHAIEKNQSMRIVQNYIAISSPSIYFDRF